MLFCYFIIWSLLFHPQVWRLSSQTASSHFLNKKPHRFPVIQTQSAVNVTETSGSSFCFRGQHRAPLPAVRGGVPRSSQHTLEVLTTTQGLSPKPGGLEGVRKQKQGAAQDEALTHFFHELVIVLVPVSLPGTVERHGLQVSSPQAVGDPSVFKEDLFCFLSQNQLHAVMWKFKVQEVAEVHQCQSVLVFLSTDSLAPLLKFSQIKA